MSRRGIILSVVDSGPYIRQLTADRRFLISKWMVLPRDPILSRRPILVHSVLSILSSCPNERLVTLVTKQISTRRHITAHRLSVSAPHHRNAKQKEIIPSSGAVSSPSPASSCLRSWAHVGDNTNRVNERTVTSVGNLSLRMRISPRSLTASQRLASLGM